MRPGTPGFIGDRLREGREARALSQSSLADLLSISRQAVSQYERNTVTPHPDIMERLAFQLNLPLSFFLRPIKEDRPTSAIFYRSLSATTATARTRAERRYGWLLEIADFLLEYVDFPTLDLPSFNDLPADPLLLSDEEIEVAAQRLRDHWRVHDAPIGNLVYLLENNGFVVGRFSLAADTLDAFSQWRSADSRPYIVLNSDKQAAARSRLDAAHELGHIVLHRKLGQVAFGRMERFQLLEKQAFRFAGAFLLPESVFAQEFLVPTLDALRVLKARWGVSIAAMIKRAEDLNFLTSDQSQRLWRAYSRRGWKQREPLDDETEPERPQILRQAIELVVSEQLVSRSQLLERLPFNHRDIEEIVGLPPRYLDEQAPEVRVLRMPAVPKPPEQTDPGVGEVLPFAPRDPGR